MAYYKNNLDIVKIVGKRLKEIRIEMGMTVKDVAERIGAATSTVVNWENGGSNISLHSLYLYCGILCIHPLMVLPRHGEYVPQIIGKKSENKNKTTDNG